MKILIIEDKKQNIEAAKRSLVGHELTIAMTADEAYAALETPMDYAKQKIVYERLLAEAGLPAGTNYYDKNLDEATKAKVKEISSQSYAEATPVFDFDVVLTDMLMPASARTMGGPGSQLVGMEMPYGLNFIFRAVDRGAKLVGLLTDMNHHHHPMAAALDTFPVNKIFQMNDSKVILCVGFSKHFIVEGQKCAECSGTGKRGDSSHQYECYDCNGTGEKSFRGKDWGGVLAYLTGESDPKKDR